MTEVPKWTLTIIMASAALAGLASIDNEVFSVVDHGRVSNEGVSLPGQA